MAHLSLNLAIDSKREIIEKTECKSSFAPHARRSGVGFVESPWFPDKQQADIFDPAHIVTNTNDSELNSITRNKERIGGALAPITTLSGSSKLHKPLKVNTGNDIEFRNARQRKSVGERLAEITELKEKVNIQRRELEKSMQQSKSDRVSSSSVKKKSVVADLPASGISVMINDGDNESVNSSNAALDDENFNELMAPVKLYEQLKKTEAVEREFQKLNRKHAAINQLKEVNKDADSKERSRDIERKRRLLTAEEAKRKGPPDDTGDKPNSYDYFATKVQTQIRRWIATKFVQSYRVSANTATVKMQTTMRAWLARNRVKKLTREKNAATEIQRNWRGMNARVSLESIYVLFLDFYYSFNAG